MDAPPSKNCTDELALSCRDVKRSLDGERAVEVVTSIHRQETVIAEQEERVGADNSGNCEVLDLPADGKSRALAQNDLRAFGHLETTLHNDK